MKLFVWAEPYRVKYGSSAVFVVAETEEQAREIARSGAAYEYVIGPRPIGWVQTITLGPPTRVVEAPCAEWHEWSE